MTRLFLSFLIFIMSNNVFANAQIRPAPPSANIIKNDTDHYRHIVGSRPGRKGSFRLESEIINGHTVVHNYGHGGYGVTLSPGTAMKAI